MSQPVYAIVILSFVLSFGSLLAQPDFAELSTKERISIAEDEELDAKRDEAFQQIMQSGHALFKEKHYLKAVHTYEKAREMRPYNVYPKVIIADIELSMKDTLATLRAAEAQEQQKTKEAEELKPEKPELDKNDPPKEIKETKEDRIEKIDDWEAQERAKRERERERQKDHEEKTPKNLGSTGEVPILSEADFQKDLASKYPSGVTEESFTEGNKQIVKRVIVKEGVGNEYRRVTHNWGGVFYFKNGEAVPERVWKKETE